MRDVIEFYCGKRCVSSVQSSMVPTVDSFINIHKATYRIVSVTFALDYSDMPFSERQMRCNVDLAEAKP